MNTWVHLHPWMAIAAVAWVAATLGILLMALLAISRDSDRDAEARFAEDAERQMAAMFAEARRGL